MSPSRRRFLAWISLAGVFPACREVPETGRPGEGSEERPAHRPAETPPLSPPRKGEDAPGDEAFLGLGEAEGAALARQRNLKSRVIAVDGVPRPATKDYRPDRINFELEKGRIIRATRG